MIGLVIYETVVQIIQIRVGGLIIRYLFLIKEFDLDYEIVHNCQVEGLNEIYKNYFGYKTDGLFVEVGGYDGYNFSNTWGLAKAGWDGFYIEPIPSNAQACRQNHKDHKVKVIECAAGNYSGSVEMQVAGPLSTYDSFYIASETWRKEYRNNRITVKIETLDNILNPLFYPTFLDLLVIDTRRI